MSELPITNNKEKKRKLIWDRNIEYDIFLPKLLKTLPKLKDKGKCYCSIAILQLTNGMRVREAVAAFQYFLKTGDRKFQVMVLKQKHEKYRPVRVPDEITNDIRAECYDFKDEDLLKLRDRYRMWLYKTFKVNSHSLRYAFVTKMAEMGLSPMIIARITGHSELRYLITYTHKKLGEKALDLLNI
jgi:integrase